MNDISDSLTHPGRVMHIANDLSPDRHKVIIWNNAGILLIQTLGTNFSELKIHTYPFKKMYLETSSVKWRSICLGLKALIRVQFQFVR